MGSEAFTEGAGLTTKGDLLVFTTLITRLAVGTNGQVLSADSSTSSGLKWATSPFTNSFASSAQTITSAGALTIAHSLGATPILIVMELVCQTGEAGYTAGDVLITYDTGQDSAANRGVSVVPDATNLNIRFGSQGAVFVVPNKGTGVKTALTNANWQIVFRAFV